MIYFSSDFHFNHKNIIKYCNRPFFTLEEMDTTIISNINSIVKEEDILYFLGDFGFTKSSEAPEARKDTFEYYRNRIYCKNIIYIKGNHDKNNRNKTINESMVINYGGERIFLTHNPEYCNVHFRLNFVGHVHEKWMFKRYRKGEAFTDCCNVGVDVWAFKPITINEIMSAYSKWKRSII